VPRVDHPQGHGVRGLPVEEGCGCRGGSCGACVTVFEEGKLQLKEWGLACQTSLSRTSIYPAALCSGQQSHLHTEQVRATDSDIVRLYPELLAASMQHVYQGLSDGAGGMNYVRSQAMRGDLKRSLSSPWMCVMCGMCAARCPGELAPFNIALLIRSNVRETCDSSFRLN